MKQNTKDTKGPAVKFPPPLVFIVFAIIFGWMNRYLGMELGGSLLLKLLGGLSLLLGVAVILIADRKFKNVGTDIKPWKPTSAIVDDGIFAYSRNPIYVAFCFIIIGIGLIISNLGVILSFLPSAFFVYLTAIKKEEAYLESKFGETYLEYKKKVRRWV